MSLPKNPLLGAHTSIAGGLHHALEQGVDIGASTVQIFTANQRQWHPKVPTQADADHFKQIQADTGIEKVMSHASYLLNLGSPDPASLEKSRQAFRREVERCRMLGISFLNFHPGAALKGSREACLDRIIASMLTVKNLLPDDDLLLLLETTAGQGSVVGSTFEEIAYLIQGTKGEIPVGVCIDTCHIFAAGYDIRSAKGWEETLDDFDKKVGLPFLQAFHLNDSMKPLGSRKDRHAPLGEGEIGAFAFEYLMKQAKINHIPKYLETPGGPPIWKKEIAWLRQLI
ncbi:MAG: deoxyribonuclease IV [Bacteroidota bacterium]